MKTYSEDEIPPDELKRWRESRKAKSVAATSGNSAVENCAPLTGLEIPTITINMDEKCSQCGKLGAMQNGICIKCVMKAMKRGEFDHILKRRSTEQKYKLETYETTRR